MKPVLNIPSWATTALGLVAGILTVLVHNTFGLSAGWAQAISTVLVLFSVLGINPLVGSAFKNALHLSPSISLAITGVLAIAAFAVTQIVGISHDVVGIIQGIIALVGALGFGTVPVPLAKMRKYLS